MALLVIAGPPFPRRGALPLINGNNPRLAAFLRARRELVKPADVGLPYSERRRVEGLRREEAAMLAGISTEYYLRLEQGRDHQPSDQVLDGLARALQLDEDAGNYLRALARPAPRRRGRSVPERFDPAVQTLIDSWPLTPTFRCQQEHGDTGV
jgi:transcriptional regulator with XRE-family HTH domain